MSGVGGMTRVRCEVELWCDAADGIETEPEPEADASVEDALDEASEVEIDDDDDDDDDCATLVVRLARILGGRLLVWCVGVAIAVESMPVFDGPSAAAKLKVGEEWSVADGVVAAVAVGTINGIDINSRSLLVGVGKAENDRGPGDGKVDNRPN